MTEELSFQQQQDPGGHCQDGHDDSQNWGVDLQQ